MKVRFNKPNRRFTNRFSFDNNTTLGMGNVQPLFCKQLCAGSKLSVSFNQLTRLSPLVVPTFARLKQRNDFVFVPMAMVMPSFDAFLSRSLISGTNSNYVPDSVPCTTNGDLLVSLLFHYSDSALLVNNSWSLSNIPLTDSYNKTHQIPTSLTSPAPSLDKFPISYFDFVLNNTLVYKGDANSFACFKLNTAGRFWLTVLRGLGYTLDPSDFAPVSILPLWAFVKAYYDTYYPKRSNPWHASNYYAAINSFYNGAITPRNYGSLQYDMVNTFDNLTSLFGVNDFTFDFFVSVDDSLVTAATTSPINDGSGASTNIDVFNNTSTGGAQFSGDSIVGSLGSSLVTAHNNIPSTQVASDSFRTGVSADQLRLVDRLWSFVQKSSVVGQSVKDWFTVHLGVKPNEDMFDQSILVSSIVNDVSINTVVSTAQTTNGTTGDNLGALAGQGYASKSASVKFDANTFGYFICLTSICPISGVSCGTQPELYLNTLYEQQLPDFDGLGYEVLNKTSFEETITQGNKPSGGSVSGGFGYVPRLSSWKSIHNIRSGNFAINSVKDSLLPYNVDVIPISKTSAGIHWRFPWAKQGNYLSFNRMFYNETESITGIGNFAPAPLDDNFMSQTAFDVSYTSYLKPLSDSFSVESLGNELVSVKEQ